MNKMLHDLYSKVDKFEKDISQNYHAQLSCKDGCSKCCYTDLSIFQVEADLISNWFTGLPAIHKLSLLKKWQEELKTTKNFQDETVSSCVFLNHESCTIYEVRPLICRTQGMALKFKYEDENFIDICPLNEAILDHLNESEVMNLDLINKILSSIEYQDADHEVRPRVELKTLRNHLINIAKSQHEKN